MQDRKCRTYVKSSQEDFTASSSIDWKCTPTFSALFIELLNFVISLFIFSSEATLRLWPVSTYWDCNEIRVCVCELMAYKWHVFRLSIENMWTCVKMDLQKDKRSIWAVLRFAVPRTLKYQESASIVKQDSWVANYVSWGLINPCSRQMYMTYPTQEVAECRCLFAHPICSSATGFLAYVIRAWAGLGPW